MKEKLISSDEELIIEPKVVDFKSLAIDDEDDEWESEDD